LCTEAVETAKIPEFVAVSAQPQYFMNSVVQICVIRGFWFLNEQILVVSSELLSRQKSNLLEGLSGSKRGQLEIMAEILLFCRRGKAKTKIMYATNINYPLLQKYSDTLTSRGLLRFENGKYVTTEKGFAFFNLFKRICDMLADKEVHPST